MAGGERFGAGVGGRMLAKKYTILYTKRKSTMIATMFAVCAVGGNNRDRGAGGVVADGNVSLIVNGRRILTPTGTSVAAAMMQAGVPCRFSVGGEARAALCGMGICMECRVTVNGVPHRRGCLLPCAEGMEVESW